METRNGLCRACAAMCPIVVDLEGGEPVSILGDIKNPLFHGYSCIKGREMHHLLTHPSRLLQSRKRQPDGSFVAIDSEQAMDEVASRLQAIIDEHGPRAVASYAGTYIFAYPATQPIATAWMDAIGSPMRFTAATIDQPGKPIAAALHGSWQAGPQPFRDADTWLLVGINPMIAKSGGVPNQNPARQLKDAVARGMKLVVIDPRRNEMARFAEVFLQPRPGEDPTVLAGIIRLIIDEGLYDKAFVAENTTGFEDLKASVEPFTPEYVEWRAGVPAADLVKAARVFGGAKRGGCTGGTGTNMAPRGNLSEYLLLDLMTLCGRWLRAGDEVPNPGVMGPRFTPRAQASPPRAGWGFGEKLRVRDFTDTVIGLPVSALADEILTEGEGQIKALICIGGNPLMAWPDQHKTQAALEVLDLFVCLDVQIDNNSCHLADYVMACKQSMESPGLSLPNEMLSYFSVGFGFEVPYGQYSPVLADMPEGADLIEEWEFFYGMARRMGIDIEFDVAYSWAMTGDTPPRARLDMQNKPTTDDIYEMLTQQSRIPLAEVKKYPSGHIFDDETILVEPRAADNTARLQLGDPTMMAELVEVAGEQPDWETTSEHPFRLISRRAPNVFNSTGRNNPRQMRKFPYNPAYMNPADAEAMELAAGDVIGIHSRHASIQGVVELDEGLRPGVVSMTHCFGAPPDQPEPVREIGAATNRLIDVTTEYDPYTGIPRMSAIPVHIEKRVND